MKIPKHLKELTDEGMDVCIEMTTNDHLPELSEFETLCIKTRDSLAKQTDSIPENVKVVGIKVFFELAVEKGDGGDYRAIGARSRFADGYAEHLSEM